MGSSAPRPGFLQALRDLTRRAGTVLIFDEVMTGFRLARGGAQQLDDIIPDMTCLGQDHRRRPARRGLRRPRRDHGRGGPGGPRVPGGHAVRQPPGHGRGRRPARPPEARGPYERLEALSLRLTWASHVRCEHGHHRHPQPRGLHVHALLLRGSGLRLRDRQGFRHRAFRPVLPRHARAGRVPPACAVRGGVRVAGPHRSDIDETVRAAQDALRAVARPAA